MRSQMSIAEEGYVFVTGCVDATALEALRAEADHLFHLKKAQDALSEDEYFDKGCALDFFTNNEMPDDDIARLSMEAYVNKRYDQPATSHGARSTGPNGERRRGSEAKSSSCRDSQTQHWTNSHACTVQHVVFRTLAKLAKDCLMSSRERLPTAPTHTSARSADESTAESATRRKEGRPRSRKSIYGGIPLLFNEQYVVKPPESSIEFGWHTDEREQLAMCVFSPGVHPPVYVSVWLALDDCDAVNGCLEIFPQALGQPRMKVPGEDEEGSVLCLPSKAGDAVVFLSNLWHRSGPNRTAKPRRVFYAQYSADVIRATTSDPRPLSLAIPCCLTSAPAIREERHDDATAPMTHESLNTATIKSLGSEVVDFREESGNGGRRTTVQDESGNYVSSQGSSRQRIRDPDVGANRSVSAERIGGSKRVREHGDHDIIER